MQSLWSRVAQTRSCKCVSCIHHSAKALSRRTATSATRRRVTAGDVFTACFSSTLATAAVLDMQSKQRRRAQWDRVIREAKGEEPAMEKSTMREAEPQTHTYEDLVIQEAAIQLSALKEQTEGQEPATIELTSKPVSSSRRGKGLCFRKIKKGQRFRKIKTDIETDSLWPTKLNGKNWKPPPPAHQTSTADQLRLLNHYINSVITKSERISRPCQKRLYKRTYASMATGETVTYFSRLTDRRPQTDIHLQHLQDMVSRLVAKLLLAAKSMESIQGWNENAIDMESRARIAAKIDLLSSSDTNLPAYGPVNTREALAQVVELNRSLSSIFQSAETGPEIMVAKVCYNLLVSQVPPDMTTYTILLLNFTKLDLGDLAHVVVDSFLNDSAFRPNEMAIAAMLNHYISRNDHSGFYGMIQRMRGVNGDMRIKKRHIYYLYHHRVVSWASRAKVIHRNRYLIEKAPRDQMIFHTLVVGTCMFNHMTRAIMFTRAMIREGYCLTLGLLNTLVRACISKSDLKSARALLRIVLNTWTSDEERNDMTRRLDISSHSRYFIRMLVSFCGVNLSESWKIEELSTPLLITFDPAALQNFTRAMHLQSIAEDVGRMEVTIYDLLSRLAPYVPMAPHIRRIKKGDPPRTWYKCLKTAEIYLSRRLASEDSRQTQKRLREKEAALLYLAGGETEERLEKARHRREREREKTLMVSNTVYHCEDDHPLACCPEMDTREIAITEETIAPLEANFFDGLRAESTELSIATNRNFESENQMPKSNHMAAEPSQLALAIPSGPALRVAAVAA